MSLYTCDGCGEDIPAHKARINCCVCDDYDTCANCYVVVNNAANHVESHQTLLMVHSGYPPRSIFPAPPEKKKNDIVRPPLPQRPSATPPTPHPSTAYPAPNQNIPPPSGQRDYHVPQTAPPIPAPYSAQIHNTASPYALPPHSAPPIPAPYSTQNPQYVPPPPPQYPPPNQQNNQPNRRPVSVVYPSPSPQYSSLNQQDSQPSRRPVSVLYPSPSPQPSLSNQPNNGQDGRPLSAVYPSPSPQPSLSYQQTGEQGGRPVSVSYPSPPPQASSSNQEISRPASVQYHTPPPPAQNVSSESTPRTFSPLPTNTNYTWLPLFIGSDGSPQFIAFLTAIFQILDDDRDGLLTPEQYSSFLDACGYKPEENVWKKIFQQPAYVYTPEDAADYELTTSFRNFSIEHVLHPRPPTQQPGISGIQAQLASIMGPSGALIAAASAVKPISGGMKPMITLPGFITITTVEFLYDPSAGWNHMQLVLNQYGIWKELGRLPREMFPELAPPELVEKVKRITAMSQRKAAELIEAKRVELAIKAQGQQNAIDLLDDRRWVYGYR